MKESHDKPIIGFPLMGKSLFRRYMAGKYINCLQKAGAEVLILAPTPDTQILEEYLAQCDGFLFPGGADIDPTLYGQEKSPLCNNSNPLRDELEYPLLKLVLEQQKPILCVCRGIQMLNIVLGGTLHQDIKDMQEFPHSDFLHKNKTTHPITLVSGTKLHAIFQQTTMSINSIHHQAIDRLGTNLIISATSPEGFIESIELDNYPFCIGVQWHPEHMVSNSPQQLELFHAFVSSCK